MNKLAAGMIGLLWWGMICTSFCTSLCTSLDAHSIPGVSVVQATLTEPGAVPFYLQAIITERSDPEERVDVEMTWAAPDKWKRTIRSREFTQTVVVNGDKSFEQDSDGYFPLGIQVLVTAMVDPKPILDALRPGDPVRTKANG